MTDEPWVLDANDGELTVHTGVAGRAARMGHRLTIVMQSWQITVEWDAGEPVSAKLVVDVDSLQVLRGEGGVTPLSGPEKSVVRSNALKTLDAGKFATIEFAAEQITASDDGYRLQGPLTIHGVTQSVEVALTAHEDGETWLLAAESEVKQTEFGIRPFSMMMGSMKVADAVTVTFSARWATAD